MLPPWLHTACWRRICFAAAVASVLAPLLVLGCVPSHRAGARAVVPTFGVLVRRAELSDPPSHASLSAAIVKASLSVALVLLGGVFSGLSLGLMGLDSMNLQVLAASGPPADRQDAQRVLSRLAHGRHFVLVCLLFSNVIVNETLPIFLDSLTGGGGWIAVAMASAAILIFGEVLPQAVCSRHGLRIGAKCTPFVRCLMYLESPICWPAARVLDLLLGSHTTQLYRREELRTLIELHASSPADATVDAADPALSGFESQILGNVLQLASIPARQSCLRSEDIYVVSDGIRVCDIDLARLLATGQSFLPVRRSSLFKDAANRSSHALVGYVTVAEVSAALKTPHSLVRSLRLRHFVQTLPSTPIIECLRQLKSEDASAVLALTDSFSSELDPIGFVTLDSLTRVITSQEELAPRDCSVSLGATARRSLSRPPRSSASLGLSRFVEKIVERHRTHRASSSQLSFRLSTSSSDGEDFAPFRALPTSVTQYQNPPQRSRGAAFAGTSERPSFRFPPAQEKYASVLELGEAFALGGEDTDGSEGGG